MASRLQLQSMAVKCAQGAQAEGNTKPLQRAVHGAISVNRSCGLAVLFEFIRSKSENLTEVGKAYRRLAGCLKDWVNESPASSRDLYLIKSKEVSLLLAYLKRSLEICTFRSEGQQGTRQASEGESSTLSDLKTADWLVSPERVLNPRTYFHKVIPGGDDLEASKVNFRNRFVEFSPWTSEYGAHVDEVAQSIEQIGCSFEVVVDQPLAIGLGTAQLFETGLSLHWLFGTPIIHGSSIKGLALHTYLNQIGLKVNERVPVAWESVCQVPEEIKVLKALFGDISCEPKVGFCDALWIGESGDKPFVADITTPHNIDYRKKKGEVEPDDTQNPIPVGSFCVGPKNRFKFFLAGTDKALLERAQGLITTGLRAGGIGAKKNLGYGSAGVAIPPNLQWYKPSFEKASSMARSDGEAVVEMKYLNKKWMARVPGLADRPFMVEGVPADLDKRNPHPAKIKVKGKTLTFISLNEGGKQ